MNYSVYILFSAELDKFYIGYTTRGSDSRIKKHLSDYYGLTKFTHKVKDWFLFLEIECASLNQARKIENHIKKMKSKKYIKNLKQYPEMINSLLNKFLPDNL